MDRLIIFDLDGVLLDSKNIHFHSLNKALSLISDDYVISIDEQEKIYEGLPTKNKLMLLVENKKLPEAYLHQILDNKQKFTKEMLQNVQKDNDLINLFAFFYMLSYFCIFLYFYN